MDAIQSKSDPSWRLVALTGAVSGIGLVFVYAFGFAAYAILRSSFSVARLTPAAVGVLPTLLANGASILVAALATAGLLALEMAAIGALTALVVAWLLMRFDRNRLPRRALLIGGTAAFAVSFACQLALHLVLVGGWAVRCSAWAQRPICSGLGCPPCSIVALAR